MKAAHGTLVALAFSLAACGAEHWDGGGRRQELPMDERTPEAGSASTDAGGSGVTSLVPDESSSAGADGEGGAAGVGNSPAAGAPSGLATAGSGGIPGLP